MPTTPQKILVTGGTGFIGSHTAVELINAGHEVIIMDNLYNSKITVLDQIATLTTGKKPTFYQTDLLDPAGLDDIFTKEQGITTVIHFAGLKAVAESVEQPLKYYEANISGTLNLLKAMQKHHVKNIIFSSSATVYGEPSTPKCREDLPTGQKISNPYGRTKYMIEEILKDLCAADPTCHAVILRYFNPIGAHPSGLLGEDPNGRPNNLMPIVMRVAEGKIPELSIYGDDYPTPDGTCIRDYIHVVDLAQGHLAALQALPTPDHAPSESTPASNNITTDHTSPESAPTSENLHIYNLGTGRGTSVKEIIAAFEQASGRPLPHKIAPRRSGDLPELCADPSKAKRELNWQTSLTIADAMTDTLNFLSHS